MKSFKKFISEKISEETQKINDRQRLEKTPFLSDDEMRKQNPGATKAYEDDVKSRNKNPISKKNITVNNKPTSNIRRTIDGIETNASPEDIDKIKKAFQKSPEKSTSRPGESSRPKTSTKSKVTKSVQRPTDRMSGIDPQPTKKPPVVQQSKVSQAIKNQAKDASKALTKTSKLSGVKSALARGASFTGKRVLPAVDAALTFGREKKTGSGNLRAAAKAATVWAGGALGAAGGSVAGPVGTIAGGAGGAMAADAAFDVVAGANAKTRAAMAKANRERQAGKQIVGTGGPTTFDTKRNTITTGDKTVKLAKTSVVTDPTTGNKEVGYLAYKDGKAVYKRGQDPSSLAKTSSNPLERIGRSLFPGAYVDHDKKKANEKLKTAAANDAAYKKALSGK